MLDINFRGFVSVVRLVVGFYIVKLVKFKFFKCCDDFVVNFIGYVELDYVYVC